MVVAVGIGVEAGRPFAVAQRTIIRVTSSTKTKERGFTHMMRLSSTRG